MRRSQSETAEDDAIGILPLGYKKSSSLRKMVSLKELKKYSVEICEFCDQRFENRYDVLVHNTKHIIIPLIKMLPHHCTECFLYCLSEEDMNQHMLSKHNTIDLPNSINNNDSKIKTTDGIYENSNENMNNYNKISQNELSNVEHNNGTENILKNFVANCKVDVEKFDTPRLDALGGKGEVEKVANGESSGKFETSSDISDLDDPIVLLAPVKDSVGKSNGEHYTSIHYDELMKSGMFHCGHCFRRFPNRYTVIVHELVHLNLSKAFIGSLNGKHKTCPPRSGLRVATKASKKYFKHTPSDLQSTDSVKPPAKCNCNMLSQDTVYDECPPVNIHDDGCNLRNIVSLCDGCYAMQSMRYAFDVVRRRDDYVRRRQCARCGCMWDALWRVRLVRRRRLADCIQFEEGAGGGAGRGRGGQARPPLTNRARLERIRNRLKLLKRYR